jgi:hypothetical protein
MNTAFFAEQMDEPAHHLAERGHVRKHVGHCHYLWMTVVAYDLARQILGKELLDGLNGV